MTLEPEPPERPDQMADLGQLQEALRPLSVSNNPEHLLTLALLRSKDDVESSVELMSRALAYDPGNPLILANLGEACLDRPEAPTCAARDLERELLRPTTADVEPLLRAQRGYLFASFSLSA